MACHPDLIGGVTIPFALTSFTEGLADHFKQRRVEDL
jgi:hypothetical protein